MFNRPLFSEILPKNEGCSPQDTRLHTVPRKLDVAKWGTTEYQQTLVQAMDDTFGTNSSTMSDDIEEISNDFKTSRTLQLPTYWGI